MELDGKDIGRVVPFTLVQPFFDGFFELTSDRSTSGFGSMSGIPYPSKVAWLKQNTDPDLWGLGFMCLRVLDMEFMSYMTARAELERKKSSKGKK